MFAGKGLLFCAHGPQKAFKKAKYACGGRRLQQQYLPCAYAAGSRTATRSPAPAAALRLHRPKGSLPDTLWTPPSSLILSQLSRTFSFQYHIAIAIHIITRAFSFLMPMFSFRNFLLESIDFLCQKIVG